jgi:hypothetical protein
MISKKVSNIFSFRENDISEIVCLCSYTKYKPTLADITTLTQFLF